MIIVNFDKNELCKKAYGLWQYDYGQVLRIQGLDLPTAVEMHFSLTEAGGEAVTRIGITKDGVTDVAIPDSLLEADGTSQDYQIYVFVYLANPDSGETTRRITLGVKSRPRPEAFYTPGEGELFEEAIQAVNDAAKRAEEAGKEATAAAGEARESASLAGKHLEDTQALAEQVEINADAVAQGTETAKELLAQAQEVASNAVISAQAAKQAETAAREAQTAAETAEDAARQYAADTEADRQEVADGKQSVAQMQSDVARMQADVQADRAAVEQVAAGFGTTAENALEAVGQAQNTAVLAVQTEGQKQATAVQKTGTQAVSDVETAKTAAQAAVTAEGDRQVVRVQEAAAEIVADREQINQNQTDIAALTDKTNTLAPGIVLDAKGEAIAVHNASEQPLAGLTVYGKSTQASEPSIEHPQEVVNAGDDGSMGVQIVGAQLIDIDKMLNECLKKNDDGSYTITKIDENKRFSAKFPISLKAGTAIRFDADIIAYNGTYHNKLQISTGSNTLTIGNSVILSSDISELKIYQDSKNAIGTYTKFKNVMISIGDKQIPYEPYKPAQTLILKTPNGLPGIPVESGGNYTDSTGQQWITDEIDLDRGVYIRRIEKVDLKKLSYKCYGRYNNLEGYRFDAPIDLQPACGTQIFGTMSNIGICKNAHTEIGNHVWCFHSSNNANVCRVGFEDSSIDSVDKMLERLNALPEAYAIFCLESPITIPLTQEEIAAYKALHTYSPNTAITNDAGAGMAVEYVADTKTYIKSVEDKITAIQAALINQNISGGGITVDDAAELPLKGLTVYGRSEQLVTTGAQLFDATDVEMKAILNMDGTTSANNSIHTSGFIKVLPNETYSVSRTRQNRGKFYDINKWVLTTDKFDFELANGGDKFTTSEKTEYVRFSIYETENLDNVMVNAGDTLKPYEPYTGGKPSPSPEHPQAITTAGNKGTLEVKVTDSGEKSQRLIIQTPGGLPGIPVSKDGNYTDENGQQWICDEIDLDRGERVRRIDIFERVTFMIHSNYEVEGSQLFRSDIKINDDELSGIQLPCMCNKMMEAPIVLIENKTGFYAAYGRIFARIKDVSDADVFNRMMADNVFLIQRPDPIITPLTQEEIAAYRALHTYAPNTTITNDAGCEMSLTYTVDTQKYIDKKIATVSAAMIGG